MPFVGISTVFCRQVPLPLEDEEGVTFATVPFFSFYNSKLGAAIEVEKKKRSIGDAAN